MNELATTKMFYRIGEVSKQTGIPAHVLRYWEEEFPKLKPTKGSGNQRLYRPQDIELIMHIKQLLYERGFTIAGAKKALKTGKFVLPTKENNPVGGWILQLKSIQTQLLSLS